MGIPVDVPPVSRLRSTLSILTLRSPFWERSGKHRFARLFFRIARVYLLLGLVLLLLENWILFRSSNASSWSPPPAWCSVEDVWLTSADGTKIHAWWMKGPDWEPGQGAVLFCHGNGGNLSHRGEFVKYWIREFQTAVLLFDYPGYGKSGGKSTEVGCYAAADAGYDWLTKEQEVPADRLILYGGSLGGAVAVDLASRKPHRALVLISTFTTLPDMAQHQYWFLPARWLVRNQFNSLAKISTVHGPVFVAHSDVDGLIPYEMGQRLFAAANEPKEFVTMRGMWHDDGGRPEHFVPALKEFLKTFAP